jgi:NAD(P) transhydrogenase subunit alpha
MHVAVPRETAPAEKRVALIPAAVGKLAAAGVEVSVQAGAGDGALHSDDSYAEAGAKIVAEAEALLAGADVVCKVQAPSVSEASLFRPGSASVSLLQPAASLELIQVFRDRQIGAFSLDLLPRISRAQSMDALSSQATVSGYRAVLLAAERFPRFFPLFMTAAGTVPPAKVLVMGAGVAGLQAIATARRLGAVVRAYDVRTAARDEVKSLGAAFVELDLETAEGTGGYAAEQSEDYLRRQRQQLAKEVVASDIVITTAAIPGRPAPRLITAEMMDGMAPGSVIVDLAAESGGNVELSRPGEDVVVNGITIYGARNVPSSMATAASFLYSRNITEFLGLFAKEGEFSPDFGDEIVAGTCVTYGGEVRHEPTRKLLEEPAP